jgi:putative colanic acid biosynthesis UDP-glucose lipid carrier transferase
LRLALVEHRAAHGCGAFDMKPGITGWAQINGYRGETTRVEQMQRRVEHDLWYIDNWSLWLDFTILVRTSFEVLGGRMAY